MNVYWLLSASESLRAKLHGKTEDAATWFARINAVLAEVFPEQVVLVRDHFQGYRDFYGMVILLIEVQPLGNSQASRFRSPGTYIVKVAFDEQQPDLKAEIDHWNQARPRHVPFDNVFVSLDAHPDEHQPTALIYGDANVVLGQRNIISLEDALTQACRFGVPQPKSIDRVLRTLYQRMSEHFYCRSHLEPAATYLHAARPQLQTMLARYDEKITPSADRAQRYDLKRRQHRRETVALLASQHEYFADPLDLLKGMQRANVGPEVLRGVAHGDIHGRNLQVSIVNDEVSQCAVYDYEKFDPANFPAWDFIKLEMETAVRLLDRLGDKDQATYVRQCLTFWRHVAVRTAAYDRLETPTLAADLQLPSAKWVRLADRLVHLRMLAYEHLGKNRGRVYEWLDEYELLATWYACRAGLYENYEPRWTIAAIVAAGVAARRLMRRLPAEMELSHRKRFLTARAMARSEDHVHMLSGEQELRQLIADYPHLLEVQEELALVLIKLSKFEDAETVLTQVAETYDYTTAETPARLGSLWKRRAMAVHPPDAFALDRALTWYQRAVEREPSNYYPRINVASMLQIKGHSALARQEAAIAIQCLEAPGDRDFWWFATYGEALLLLGEKENVDKAFEHYHRALRDRACQPQDRKSMVDQLRLLQPHLSAAVQSVLTTAALEQLFSMDPSDTP